jgi:hypothetical protein
MKMKSLVLAASAVSLLALAGPVSAQGYMARSANPYDGPMHYAPDNGPQMRYMETHGSTVLDNAPYNGGDAYSDDMSRHDIYLDKGPGLYIDPSQR